MKTTTPLIRTSIARAFLGSGFIFTAAALACFGILPTAEAVNPPPDGGYPGNNTAEGQGALLNLTTGAFNTALGAFSLRGNTVGNLNTAVGAGALLIGSTAERNTAIGFAALYHDTTGVVNTANGAFALFSNSIGSGNTATGISVLSSNTTGSFNTAMGDFALSQNASGSLNTAIGDDAGYNITGSGNVCIGAGVTGGVGESNTTRIRNVYETVQPVIGINPDYVTVNSTGRLGRANVSSRRYKHDIKPIEKASEALFNLKPVSFRYKKEFDSTQTLAFGLIAEEVAEVYPDLVGRNANGQPESVRYDQINAMLLNEFLKEHRKVEEQNRKVQKLEAALEAVNAHLKLQDANIRKVRAEIGSGGPALKTVANDP